MSDILIASNLAIGILKKILWIPLSDPILIIILKAEYKISTFNVTFLYWILLTSIAVKFFVVDLIFSFQYNILLIVADLFVSFIWKRRKVAE